MKRRIGFALILLLFAIRIGRGQSPSEPDNGYWWVSQSETYKLALVNGFAMAMTTAADRVALMCLADKNGGVIPEKYPGEDMLKVCAQTPTVTLFSFGGIRFGQLVEGMDEFYKDFRNKGVYVTAAMFFVRDEIKGKSPKELDSELNVIRHGTAKP